MNTLNLFLFFYSKEKPCHKTESDIPLIMDRKLEIIYHKFSSLT